jgi:hypothetical protein
MTRASLLQSDFIIPPYYILEIDGRREKSLGRADVVCRYGDLYLSKCVGIIFAEEHAWWTMRTSIRRAVGLGRMSSDCMVQVHVMIFPYYDISIKRRDDLRAIEIRVYGI